MIPIYEPDWKFKYTWAILRQIGTGWIGPGPKVEEFRTLIGRQFDRFCTVVNSGTSALMLAYLALDLPRGSTICCPDYGLPACQNAAKLLGFEVALIDVNPATCCTDVQKLARYLKKAGPCSCVVFVNHNGYTGNDLDEVAALCAKHRVHFIEDSAVALGCNGAGTSGIISTLSFSVPKIITTGQGGAVLTSNPEIAERLQQLVDQGGGNWRKERLHSAIGGNFRMPDLLAAIGVAQLEELPRLLVARDLVWRRYREGIVIANDIQPSGWLVTCRAADADIADRIINRMNANGFECRRLYRPVHSNLPYKQPDSSFPGAMEVYNRLLYLPSSPHLKRHQIEQVCQIVSRAL